MTPALNQYIFICSVLFAHWVADFVAQSDKIAKAKAKDFDALFSHCAIYATFMTVWCVMGMWIPYTTWGLFVFAYAVFLSHITIDYFTSKLNSYLYGKGQVHNFFVSVGFDQWLHYASVFGIIMLMK
jgi:hypothetical protein